MTLSEKDQKQLQTDPNSIGYDLALDLATTLRARLAELESTRDSSTFGERYAIGSYLDRLHAKLARDHVMAELSLAGVVKAVASYDGSGDEGWFRECCVWRTSDNLEEQATESYHDIEILDRDDSMRPEIKLFCEYAQNATYAWFPGWENNEGAQGEVIFELDDTEFTIRIDHGWNVMETQQEGVTL